MAADEIICATDAGREGGGNIQIYLQSDELQGAIQAVMDFFSY